MDFNKVLFYSPFLVGVIIGLIILAPFIAVLLGLTLAVF